MFSKYNLINFNQSVLTPFKKLIIQNKKYIIFNLIITAILVIGVVIIFNNYNWYDTTIVRIQQVENSLSNESKVDSAGEKYYNQIVIGTIMNGKLQGQKALMRNKYSSSGVFDDEYKAKDEVFVDNISDDNGKLTGSISGLKRDKYMAILLALFILLLFIVTNKKGFFSLISLTANITVFWYALDLYFNGRDILMLSNGLVLFFTCSSLLFISGLKKKTFVAILTTLITVGFTMILFKIVMAYTDGVDYTYMVYIASQKDLSEIFMSQILLGGLGAIMDVAITEASTINELVVRNNEISVKELLRAGREVGHDIMGTMINVMLFTYICGSIPLIILKMKNDVKLHTIILWHIPMEMYRFLIGSIGILLAIPISLFVSIILFKKLRRPI